MQAHKTTVGELEAALFGQFPREWAESWDNVGLAVGDRDTRVERIAFNLDMTTQAVVAAHERGCNVLVTHHPPFIKGGPSEFAPAGEARCAGPGRMVYEAVRRGVNVINMHTNADRSPELRELYATLLGCECVGSFEALADGRDPQAPGLGAVLVPGEDARSLHAVAAICKAVLGGCPRVWGDPCKPVERFAFLNGSWGEPELYDIAVANGIDALVVGETKYHPCVDAQPHLAIVDVGHDISELPIVALLHQTLAGFGFAEDELVDLQCSEHNWWVLD